MGALALLAGLFLLAKGGGTRTRVARAHRDMVSSAAKANAQIIEAAAAAGLPVPDFIKTLPPEQQLAITNAPGTYGASLLLLDPSIAKSVGRIGAITKKFGF